jgi:Lon protease-like protein
MLHDQPPSFKEPIGLFPLPNVVMFPGTMLPLQIFEPRYRAMVRDAIDRHRLIAMAFLLPGYEGYYHTNLAKVAPTVCVGRIRDHVQIPDGRYFINLQGLCRARVRSEDRDGEYRLAHLDPVRPHHNAVAASLETDVRRAVQEALGSPLLEQLSGIDKCRGLMQRSGSLEELLDFTAAVLLPADAVEIKQRLLEEPDVLQRAAILIAELRRIENILDRHQRNTDNWPRPGSMN